MDKYIKSKVGSDKYGYTGFQGAFDMFVGMGFKALQLKRYARAQASKTQKGLWNEWDHLRRSYKSKLTANKIKKLMDLEKDWKNYGNQMSDIIKFKFYKKIIGKVFRPKGQPVPESQGETL